MEDKNGVDWRFQLKVDGYRATVHLDNGDVTVFSRAKNDVSESLPEIQELSWPENGKYIFDGEIIASDGSYSTTSSRIGRGAENVERDVEMEYAAFDCVVYQGDDISEWTYENRFSAVSEMVHAVDDDRLWMPKLWYDYDAALEMVAESDAEGLILKRMDAPYEFGKRSKYWIKDKHDADTIDVVITGFYEGDGEATGTLGGVSIESADGISLGRSGSGFSDEERDEIWNNQDAYINRVIEVEARGLGTGDNLRMPIFLRHRPEGEADPFSRIEEVMNDV